MLRTTSTCLVAAALMCAPVPGAALAPMLALMIKQMVQQSITSNLKDILLDSLRGMGCRGSALANALTALDARGGPTATLGMPGMSGLPGMSGAAGMGAQEGQMMRALQAQMPAGMALSPEHAAMMSQLQGAMAQPLSPPQTIAAIDEMAELGFLPKPMQTEMKECMVLLPQSAPIMGMAMGMLAPMLPQIRQARDQMHAMSKEEQDEFAATMAEELKGVPAEQRKLFLEHIDAGFFPSAVAAGVKSRLGSK